jgi:hypothetical protein
MNRRQMLGTLAAGTSLGAGRLAAMQGVILGELKNPVNLNALREKYQAADPVDLKKLRDSRWTRERTSKYMERFGVVKGVNYSTRFGPVFQEWNEHTIQELFGSGARARIEFPPTQFNEQVIQQELGWAQNVVGLNTLRLFLSITQYQQDREQFYKKFERFLEIAASKGMSVMPVTSATGLRDPDKPASQKVEEPEFEFKPSVIFGGFRSAARGVRWDDGWPRLKPVIKDFIQTFIGRYANDKRIILWDLCNEPPTAQRPLVEYLFQWAREVNPSQPLSVCWNAHDLSDVITFHTYMRPGLSSPQGAPARVDFLTELEWARAWKRPILCTEWLARPFGSTVENTLPFFSRYSIGWYSFGLVAGGPAQYQYPWNWPVGSPTPKEWFHCLLYPDGSPYRAEEILAIRDFKYQRPPEFVKTQSYWDYGADIRDTPPAVD